MTTLLCIDTATMRVRKYQKVKTWYKKLEAVQEYEITRPVDEGTLLALRGLLVPVAAFPVPEYAA